MAFIYMSNGEPVEIDDEDFAWLSQYKWRPDKDGYARTTWRQDGTRYDRRMHRMILDASRGQIVDHIDGNRLNNRKNNLRFVSSRQNSQNMKRPRTNTTGYKGVVKRRENRYEAKVTHGGDCLYCGTYTNALAAAHAYNYNAKLCFGQFAQLNEVEPLDDWRDFRVATVPKSQWRGVSEKGDKWQASIFHEGQRVYIGLYETEIQAALAYNAKASELKGESAVLNEVEDDLVC